MESILQELYIDGLNPSELPKRYLAERDRLTKAHAKLHDEIYETLTDKQKTQFNTFLDHLFKDLNLGDCEAFIHGFQLGARIMLEVLALPSLNAKSCE
ncbi:MAG: hypothetical protein IJ313_04890 [Clostridia bacterium]|nr:hypothetical protein [Clostridia bacterium]